jgi:hypothetical protein
LGDLIQLCSKSNGHPDFLSPKNLERIILLAHAIPETRLSEGVGLFNDVISVLVTLRQVTLLRHVEETDAGCITLFQHWLDLISAVISYLIRYPSKIEFHQILEYVLQRVLELGTPGRDTIPALMADVLLARITDHKATRSVVNLMENLILAAPRSKAATRALIDGLIRDVAGWVVGGNRVPSEICPDTEGKMIRFLLKTNTKTSEFHLSQFILNFFNGSPESALMHLEAIMSKQLDDGIVRLAVEFACSELSFTSQALRRKSIARSDEPTVSPLRVPKLILSGHTSDDADPGSAKSYPLANPSMLSLNFLTFTVNLIFLPNGKSFNSAVIDNYPSLSGKPAILFHILRYMDWLDRNSQKSFCEDIIKSLRKMGFHVLADLLWNKTDSENLSLLGSGQFGAVYRTKHNTAVKFIKVPRTANDRCTLYSALGEALCQSLMTKDSFCLSLISCGRTADKECFFIESELFSTNLKTFRKSLPGIENTPTLIQLLIVFAEILSGVQHLHTNAGVVHYDLKLENILVDCGNLKPGAGKLIIPKIAIADFGEARILFNNDVCTRNRGTECIKSPEMLSLAGSSRLKELGSSRNRFPGTGTPSDIWSLGCLFFELMTGDFLFSDPEGDWLGFYYRLTNEFTDIVNDESRRKLANIPELVEFIRYVLVREPSRRPHIDSVVQRFQSVYRTCLDKLPPGSVVNMPPVPGLLEIQSIF